MSARSALAVLALLLAPPALAEEGAGPPAEAAAAAPVIPPAAEPAAPDWNHAWQVHGGAASYERFYVVGSYQPGPRSSIGALLGSSLGTGGEDTYTAGLDWRYAFWAAPRLPTGAGVTLADAGLLTRALYWTRSTSDYDWKLVTLELGAYGAMQLRPDLFLVPHAGVALTFDVGADRKQNVNFEYPTRWNGFAGLELRYRFDTW
ncbi:MAG: hypothetical protein QM767_23200 [Anaeromyxobacter sp.]